ncbi:hypothetical protein F0562_005512 [Nyssa sinensis]|uniref:Uncharacterized protein n=1 Tax=Nyssa sinensis TaxID=561372 RepID=A0A5J5AKT1_9ASTE|nr:hypothetical protein F0562_005512 [Nyssa sinensis]
MVEHAREAHGWKGDQKSGTGLHDKVRGNTLSDKGTEAEEEKMMIKSKQILRAGQEEDTIMRRDGVHLGEEAETSHEAEARMTKERCALNILNWGDCSGTSEGSDSDKDEGTVVSEMSARDSSVGLE